MAFKDLSGHTFGYLTVVERAKKPEHVKRRDAYFLCRCKCGNPLIVNSASIKQGLTKSCGCKHRESASNQGKSNATHKMSHTPEHRAWAAMKKRCHNPRDGSFHRYGGRGLYVCEKWLHSFNAFFADLGKRPGAEYSLERIDNSLGYIEGNVCWATKKEQARNRRSSRLITFNGKTKTLAEWVEITGIKQATLWMRIFRRGWDIEAALTKPVLSNKQRSIMASQNSE